MIRLRDPAGACRGRDRVMRRRIPAATAACTFAAPRC